MISRQNYKDYMELSISSVVPTMEEIEMKAYSKKKKEKIITAAILSFVLLFIGSNGIVYATTGRTWVSKIAQNSILVEYTERDNEDSFSATSSGDYYEGYTELVDGRTYFIFEDIRTDITDMIADNNYYMYEYTDDEEIRHVIVVGEGMFLDTDHGKQYCSLWEETLYYPNGGIGSVAQLGDMVDEIPAWLEKAHKDMGPLTR